MYSSRIAAAEEIQLLLPEDRTAPAGGGALLVGVALLCLVLPCWALREGGRRGPTR